MNRDIIKWKDRINIKNRKLKIKIKFNNKNK